MTQARKTYEPHQAVIESQRCLMCDDSPCNNYCPAGIDIKGFIRKIRFDHMDGAVRLIKDANILGGVCAYICPTEKLCEKECSNKKLTRPVDVSGLQQYVMEYERKSAYLKPIVPQPKGKKVAVIGSGPSGLSCAAGLAVRGYDVTVFEAADKIGGVLRSGIPWTRLPEDVLDYEINYIKEKLGVKFKLNSKITSVDEPLKSGFDAVYVSHGLGESRKLGIPGENLSGVYNAIDFLRMLKNGKAPKIGQRVLVVGGGSVAMDVVVEVKKLGGERRVYGVCLEDYDEMPAVVADKEGAWKAGVEYHYRVLPLEILGTNNVSAFRGVNIRWQKPGLYVPSNAEKISGTEFELKVDTVIIAIGQAANDAFGLKTKRGGYIEVDKNGMTSETGVFAGGDAVRGPALAVEGVADGNKAARNIDRHLSKTSIAEKFAVVARPHANLSVDFCGVKFENPFILSAAPPSDDLEMVRNAFKAGWAGAVLKTTSIESEKVDLVYPMMSGLDFDGKKVVGFGNIDLISEHHIDEIEKRVKALKKEFPTKVVIASIMGSKKEEWQHLVGRLKAAGVDMIECSFSCPQGTLGSKPGAMLAQDAKLAKTVASWVKEAAGNLPVVIKITPQVEDIVDTARAVKEAGCDGVCASNTIPSLMGINLDTFVPNPNVNGKSTYSGMSGPAVKPLTLKCIAEISRRIGIPITGTGGPTTWRDAVEFMLVGARTVQFCTAVMHYGYGIIDDLKDGVADFLDKKGLRDVKELIGRSLPHITTHDELVRQKNLRSKIDENKCISCGECIISCKDGGHMAIAWKKDERKPAVDDEKCVGCGLCRVICPVANCIELKDTPKKL